MTTKTRATIKKTLSIIMMGGLLVQQTAFFNVPVAVAAVEKPSADLEVISSQFTPGNVNTGDYVKFTTLIDNDISPETQGNDHSGGYPAGENIGSFIAKVTVFDPGIFDYSQNLIISNFTCRNDSPNGNNHEFDCVIDTGLIAGASKNLEVSLPVKANASTNNVKYCIEIMEGTGLDGQPTTNYNEKDNPDNKYCLDNAAIVVNPQADISITKTDGKSTIDAGTVNTYTITVTNNSTTQDAIGILVTDTFPVDFTNALWTCTNCGATISDSGNINQTIDLVAEASAVYTVTGTVASDATGTLSNTATITYQPDTDPLNNTATDTTTINDQSRHITILKDATAAVERGQDITYTITLTNDGQHNVAQTTFSDVLPAGLTLSSKLINNVDVDACDYEVVDPRTITCDFQTFKTTDGPITITFTATVDANFVGTSITNTGTVSGQNMADNSDDATTQIVAPHITIDKTAPATANAGDALTYTVVITNDGTSPATGLTFSDVLNADVTFVSVTPNDQCAYITATRTVACEFSGSLSNTAGSNTKTVTINTTITGTFTAERTISNTAVASAKNGNEAQDSASTLVSPKATIQTASADLAIVKTATPAPVTAGQDLTYTLTINNLGTDTAHDVVVTDVLPSNMTFKSAGTSSACVYTDATRTVTCTAATLNAGSSIVFTAVVTISASTTGSVTNTATVAGREVDPNINNNTSTAVTPVETAASNNGTETPVETPTETTTPTSSDTGSSTGSTAELADTGTNTAAVVMFGLSLLTGALMIRRYRLAA